VKALLVDLLDKLYRKEITPQQALDKLQHFPYQDLSFAKVDHARELRRGTPEVIFGQGKTPDQLVKIATAILKKGSNLLITRLSPENYRKIRARLKAGHYHEQARCLTVLKTRPPEGKGRVAVISAGTSDVPVAEEAALTAEFFGNVVDRVYDVGVAGLHRLLGHYDLIKEARVLVVVAGMEGALPSVVAGLFRAPVIAVPTSVGYGANFQGLSALLAMLNSCPGGVAVVNIDNGFGAGYLASLINHL
jgi:NCAIR mutase (PurE)-related protein